MSNFLLPSIDKIKLQKRNEPTNRIVMKDLNGVVKNFRNYLYGNNNTNTSEQKFSKNIKFNKSANLKRNVRTNIKEFYNNKKQIKLFWKNKTYLDLENNKNINTKLNLLLINKSFNKLNNSVKNKNYNNFSIKYKDEFNTTEANTQYMTKDIFKDLYNNDKSNLLYKNKDKILSRALKVKKIVDSLINSTDEENKKENETIKIKFPKEKSVDPFSHIKYNLKKNPYNKALYKGIKTIMTKMSKSTLRKEYENNLIQKSKIFNDLKVDSIHLEAPTGEAKFYKKKCDDLISQIKINKSFYFNNKYNSQKESKIANYNPQRNYLDQMYKKYFEKKFKIKNIDIGYYKKEKKEFKIDMNLEKNIDKYLSFDSRINNILFITKKTEDNINKKRKEHEQILNKFNCIFNTY